MKKRYPFKFPDAYTLEDTDIFFGRKEEIDSLYNMVFQADLLLVYGASGTGKTSLIQCGLAGKFQSHDWYPLWIRRGKNLNRSIDRILEEYAVSEQEEKENLDWLDEDFTVESTTQDVVESSSSPLVRQFRAMYREHFKPIYLIFDQFEELYTLGNKQEQREFIETVKEILKLEQPIKIILSIREEYLGYLYEFEKEVPELLRKKLRVEPMNLDKVKAVIKGVDKLKQSNVHLKKGQEDAFSEEVFSKIRGEEKTLNIQLPYLQVFLDKLYMQLTKDQERQSEAFFTVESLHDMGNIGDVLRDFLDEQVKSIRNKLAPSHSNQLKEETIWSILSPFATLEGTKAPTTLPTLQEQLKPVFQNQKPALNNPNTLIKETVESFVNSRILRYSEEEELYELAHDSLAKRIAEKRSDEEIALLEIRRLVKSQASLKDEAREFFSEKQLNVIEPYREKLELSTKEKALIEESYRQVETEKRKNRRRRQLLFGGMAFALVILSLLSLWALQQQKIAVEAQTQAVEAQNAAEEKLIEAYQADINRHEGEIRASDRNLNLFEKFKADDDVIDLEQRKIDSLRLRIKRLKGQIDRLKIEK